MSDTHLSVEDREAVRGILLGWREDGVANPLLPTGDLTGDGVTDSFGLDENDEVIVVPGVALDETVYVSEGDDIGPEDAVDVPLPGYADED